MLPKQKTEAAHSRDLEPEFLDWNPRSVTSVTLEHPWPTVSQPEGGKEWDLSPALSTCILQTQFSVSCCWHQEPGGYLLSRPSYIECLDTSRVMINFGFQSSESYSHLGGGPVGTTLVKLIKGKTYPLRVAPLPGMGFWTRRTWSEHANLLFSPLDWVQGDHLPQDPGTGISLLWWPVTGTELK